LDAKGLPCIISSLPGNSPMISRSEDLPDGGQIRSPQDGQ